MKNLLTIILFCFTLSSVILPQNQFESDTIATSGGDLVITFIGHGTLMFEYNDIVIHADPAGMFADYSELPKADIVLVTHQHGDHFSAETINKISKDNTKVVLTEKCAEQYTDGIVLLNGEEETVDGINVKAVPAYNLVHKRDNGKVFHPKGEGNGYVITFGDKRVYIAGDTENVPEMKELDGIDIAFVPMNLPYTMTPAMAADAVRMLNPKIFYPYHFGDTDTGELLELLSDKDDCDIRIRNLE
jgi:L-ascorbate metabolism protein UlaG (beta-lactamase superfamily)